MSKPRVTERDVEIARFVRGEGGISTPFPLAVSRLAAYREEVTGELLSIVNDSLDLLRAIIDQGALKHVAHLADEGASLRMVAHEIIDIARAAIARAEGRE